MPGWVVLSRAERQSDGMPGRYRLTPKHFDVFETAAIEGELVEPQLFPIVVEAEKAAHLLLLLNNSFEEFEAISRRLTVNISSEEET